MAGFGAGIGRSLSGYYDGRNQRLNAKDRDVDRERELKMRETYDPMDLEAAMLTLDRARRTGELEEFINQRGIPKKEALRSEEFAVASQGPNLRALKRGDVLGEASLQPNLNAISRGDAAGGRAEELAGIQQPGKEAGARFASQYAGDQRDDYGANKKFWDDFQNVTNAMQTFRMTGNPKIIMDAYSMYMDDGISANITKLPPSEKGGPARYKVETDNDVEPVEFESAEELAQATEQIFMNWMQSNQPLSAYGIGPMSGGRGMDPFDPNSGRRMGSSEQGRTAGRRDADYIYEQIVGNPDYAGLSEQQLRLRAWSIANMKKEGSATTTLSAHYSKVFLQLTKGSGTFGKGKMEPEEARAAALEEVKALRDMFFPGEQIEIPENMDVDGTGAGFQSEIDSMIGRAQGR